jgi:hypothetical protein
MRLICPSCGAIASVDAWKNDEEMRAAMAVVAALPGRLPAVALSYCGLFRPMKSALAWSRVAAIARELAALVASGHVQIDTMPARPCPPAVWVAAIEDMLADRDRLRAKGGPMKNHNYLRRVAYSKADAVDAAAEKKRNEAERTGNTRALAPAEESGPMDRAAVLKELDGFKQKMGW